MSISILNTKLYIPPTRSELVPRPRLTERLDQAEQTPSSISLIAAPPGFGKTTLLGEWLHQRKSGTQNLPVAWLSLDEQDNDPTRFWSYVFAALDGVQKGVASGALTLLQAPEPQPIETTLTTLINSLAEISRPFTLILDDYHLIKQEAIHQAMTFLLDHLPPQVHLVIASRIDPPFPLTRFRVRRQLLELRENDLRFTPAEAATFLNQVMGLQLAPADLAALESRTEGWIAGLQLAALSMQDRDDLHHFVQAFTGSHRYVLDYLAEEVLAQQPEPIRLFLLQTSILERLCGPLCDAVVGLLEVEELESKMPAKPKAAMASHLATVTSPGQLILEYLDQLNLFIFPLDDQRRWYRYHHLFAEFLQIQLLQTVDEATRLALHHRASDWYARNRLLPEAVNHALAAKDFERGMVLIEQVAIALLTDGEVVTLLTWLEALPQEIVRSRPRLSLALAWVMLITGVWNRIETALEDAEKSLRAFETGERAGQLQPTEVERRGMWGEVAALRAMILGNQGETGQAINLIREALEQLPQENLVAQGVLKMQLGTFYESIGEVQQAAETLSEAITIAQASDNLITVITASHNLATLREDQGQLFEAARLYEQTLHFLKDFLQERAHPDHPLPVAGRIYIGLAEIFREQNELVRATEYLTKGLESGKGGDVLGTRQISYIVLARIFQAQGELAVALEAIEKARELERGSSPVYHWIEAVRARLWLAQGNLAAAAEWVKTCGLPLDDSLDYLRLPGEYATLVRVFIAQEQFEMGEQLLARMRRLEETKGRRHRLLEISLLEALLLYAQGEADRAMRPFSQALTLAEPGGYVRLFVDEGAPVAALLQQATRQYLSPGYVRKLLAAFNNLPGSGPGRPAPPDPALSTPPADPALIEPLTDRELEVLHLLAAGMSNQEIGQALMIAEGTVKKHIYNISGKLGVRSRTQVVLQAQELGLI